MREKLEKRKKTNAFYELIVRKLDPIRLQLAYYFASKTKKNLYAAGKDMLIMNTYRSTKKGVYYVHISYYHDFHREAAKALRMLLYGFIMNDISDIIIVNLDCNRRILNLFDDQSINDRALELTKDLPSPIDIDKINTKYQFRMYSGWKEKWIISLLRMAVKYEDPDMFAKILKRVPDNTYDDLLYDMANGTIFPIEYRALIMRRISESSQDDMIL